MRLPYPVRRFWLLRKDYPGSLGSRQDKGTIMAEEDVRKAWGMVRRAAVGIG
jgi:hypothetical protein